MPFWARVSASNGVDTGRLVRLVPIIFSSCEHVRDLPLLLVASTPPNISMVLLNFLPTADVQLPVSPQIGARGRSTAVILGGRTGRGRSAGGNWRELARPSGFKQDTDCTTKNTIAERHGVGTKARLAN